MILRLSFLLLLLFLESFAVSVLISKESFSFEEEVNIKKLKLLTVPLIKKSCTPVRLDDIKNKKYVTTHYINKNSIICKKDIKLSKNKRVVFDFGTIKIEKKGKIIFENDRFIRIKNENGKIEKIFKNGYKK